MAKPLQWYLKLLACLTVVSGLGQMGLPTKLGAASAWGAAPGWQREIAFWNLAIYIVIAQALRADDAVGGRAVAIALVTLQLLVATNHAEAAIASHATLNVVMSAVNYSCAAFGILARSPGALGMTPQPHPSLPTLKPAPRHVREVRKLTLHARRPGRRAGEGPRR